MRLPVCGPAASTFAASRSGECVKALVIDEPWISLILKGAKTWEMRSRHTSVRGRIALIRKGSGIVVGVADLVDSVGPLDEIAWKAHRSRHQIPLEQQAATANWNIAWLLEDARRLVHPVPYLHPNGAVVWVNLPDDVVSALRVDHQGPALRITPEPAPRAGATVRSVERSVPDVAPSTCDNLVPVARDGTWFSPALRRAGGYTIGAKGEEQVVADYHQALAQLREMTVPRWRRPNPKGNWGIVAGVSWESVDRLA